MRIALAGSLLAAAMICGPAHAADIAAGKAKAELCVGCHGENGISQMENIPSLAAQPDHVHPVAAGVLPRRHPQERADAADRRAAQQRGHPQSRRLFRLAAAAEGAGRRQSGSVEEGRAGRGGPALRVMPLPIPTPAPRRSPASPASARNISSRRCTTTSRACDPAAPWRRWRMSPIPSAKKRSRRWRIIWRICNRSSSLRTQGPILRGLSA